MKDVALSIILPIYNVEQYLDKCIYSVRNQKLKNIEIILATDGPDSCDLICVKHAQEDERVKLIMHPGSYGKAFNVAVREARGEYIGIVETDDWCEPDFFYQLYELAKDCGADIVKGGFIESFDDSELDKVRLVSRKTIHFQPINRPHYLSFQPSVWSAIYRRDFLIEKNLCMIEERMSFIDGPFAVKTFLEATTVALSPTATYHYFQDNPNQSVKNQKASYDGLRGEEWLYKNINIDNFSDMVKRELISSTIRRLHWNLKRLDDPEDFLAKCVAFFKRLMSKYDKCFVLVDPEIYRIAKEVGFPIERLRPPSFFRIVHSSGRIRGYFYERRLFSISLRRH